MSKSYSVIAGETFSSISRKVLGSEQHTTLIQSANPGALEPLKAGTVLVIPDIAGAPKDATATIPSNTPNEVAVLIGGDHFRFWEDIRITRSIDRLSTLEFSAPFEPDESLFRKTFVPFTFKDLQINVGGAPLFSGTLIDVTPNLTPTKRTIYVSGYSKPGVLEDCTLPSTVETEYAGDTLDVIAKAMAAPFGINVVFNDSPGPSFDLVAIKPEEKVLKFLAKLAQQRNLVITNDEEGNLVFEKSIPAGQPVAVLKEGEGGPLLTVTPSFSPQQYYSHITGIEPVMLGLGGSDFTAKNPRLEGVIRPLVFTNPDSLGAEITTAVNAKLGRMFANMMSYTITVDTWRDPSGNLWEPNKTIKIEAPGAMIYSPFEFLIRSVMLVKQTDSESASLELMLPGGFSGEAPEKLPWD